MSEELPKPGTRRFMFETLRSGQPRPYADSEYEYIITVEWVRYASGAQWEPNDISDDIVKQTARGYCCVKFPEDKPDWADTTVTSFSKIGPGKWRLFATRAFTD